MSTIHIEKYVELYKPILKAQAETAENSTLAVLVRELGRNPAVLSTFFKALVGEKICSVEGALSSILELVGQPKSEDMVVGLLVLNKLWAWLQESHQTYLLSHATKRIEEVIAVWETEEHRRFQVRLVGVAFSGF